VHGQDLLLIKVVLIQVDVPPHAGVEVEVDYKEEDELHQVHELLDLVDYVQEPDNLLQLKQSPHLQQGK